MSDWVSGQHKSSLPAMITGSMKAFIAFMDIVALNIVDLSKELLQESRKGKGGVTSSICSLASSLRGMVVKAVGDERVVWVRSHFISSKIINDISEIYCDPFGPPETDPDKIFMGSGSTQALNLFRDNKGTGVLSQVLSQFNSLSSNGWHQHLESMGLMATPGGGCAVALNGRELNLCDVEHVMCKVYSLVYKTLCERSVSIRPLASRPEFHPIRLYSGESCPWDDGVVSAIMEKSRRSASSLVESGQVVLPEVCLLMGETREVTLISGNLQMLPD